MKTNLKRPKAFGTGLVALDLVMGIDPSAAVQSWVGGTCGNVMTILSYLGWETFPIARMNGDPASERARADLQQWGVRLDFANCSPTGHTPIVIQQIRRARDGSPTHRFLWSCPHCGQRLPGYRAVTQHAVELIEPHLKGSSVFFMDRLSRAALTLAAHASSTGALVVFEPSGKSDPKLFSEAINLAHIVKYADQRLESASGIMQDGSATLLEVQTLGDKGLRYRHRLESGVSSWQHINSYSVTKLVDTCGSGDWCTAGLLLKVAGNGQSGLKNMEACEIHKALQYGQALAAWNCGFEGARGGMYAIEKRIFSRQIQAILAGRPNLVIVEAQKPIGLTISCPLCPPVSIEASLAIKG